MTPLTAFAEPGQFTSHSDNAYASPANRDAYQGDWSLLKRIAFWAAMFAIAVSACCFVSSWITYKRSRQNYIHDNPIAAVEDFVFGWQRIAKPASQSKW